MGPRTRLVAVTAAGDILGTMPDLPRIAEITRAAGALLFVDGVHATPHMPVDMVALGADFRATSACKWNAPHVGAIVAAPALLAGLHPDKLLPRTAPAVHGGGAGVRTGRTGPPPPGPRGAAGDMGCRSDNGRMEWLSGTLIEDVATSSMRQHRQDGRTRNSSVRSTGVPSTGAGFSTVGSIPPAATLSSVVRPSGPTVPNTV